MIKAEWTNADALNLQPTCNQLATDCISRQAAIDALGYCQTYLFDSFDKDKKISLEDAEYAIEQLPTAERKGHWIDLKCGSASLWKCSECGELFLEDFYYCPNCGADMRGGNDG